MSKNDPTAGGYKFEENTVGYLNNLISRAMTIE